MQAGVREIAIAAAFDRMAGARGKTFIIAGVTNDVRTVSPTLSPPRQATRPWPWLGKAVR